jgi:hypothetical protein
MLCITSSAKDTELLFTLEGASREVETPDMANRVFYVETDTRYFPASNTREMQVDDLLSVTSFTADTDRDGTYDGQTWTEGLTEDFYLFPLNSWPATSIKRSANGEFCFTNGDDLYKIAGSWGYGDGQRSEPWDTTSITVTVADATTTTIDLSDEGTIAVGQTILVESEQMYVTAVTSDGSDEATVERGVNGTTAVAHAAALASTASYPADVVRATLYLAAEYVNTTRAAGVEVQTLGGFRQQYLPSPIELRQRLVNRVRKEHVR